jgi:hypothetical protein
MQVIFTKWFGLFSLVAINACAEQLQAANGFPYGAPLDEHPHRVENV